MDAIKPKISVIMAVYNGEKYLKDSIESILNQTFDDFEFIIINDGSTDNSLEIIFKYRKMDKRIIIIDRKNKGLAYSLNEGIMVSKGEYIARMDADDISLPNRFYEQKNFLENNEDIVAIGSGAQIIDEDGNYIYTKTQEKNPFVIKNKILPYNSPFIHPSVMIKKEVLIKSNLYPLIPIAQDLFLFNELSRYGKFSNIETPLIKYRLTQSSSSRRSYETINILNIILDNYLKTGKIRDDLIEKLNLSIKSTSKKEKKQDYYLLLTKKYLWNSFNPFEARRNIKRYLLNNFDLKGLLLFIMTFLPKNMILFIYRKFKIK